MTIGGLVITTLFGSIGVTLIEVLILKVTYELNGSTGFSDNVFTYLVLNFIINIILGFTILLNIIL